MPTIFVVDDSATNLHTLRHLLIADGYQVHTASTGSEALRLIPAARPDLILLDIMLPGPDGYQVCRQLKADPVTREIPVIFITALTNLEDKILGFEMGGVDYVTKPFQSEEVLARVKTHLTIRALQRQIQQENERFRGLAAATFEGVIIHDQEQIVEVNQVVADVFGYTHEELLHKKLWDLFAPALRKHLADRIDAARQIPCAVEGQRKDGSTFPVEIQTKPIHWEGQAMAVAAVRDISWRTVLEQEHRMLTITFADCHQFGELIGRSPAMQRVYERLLRAAVSQEHVILYGETGVGKELAARTIFALSLHHTGVFVPVHCGAIPDTLFESQVFGYRKGAFTGADRDTTGYLAQAQDGTLFLDEVGELTLPMQTKLLRVLNDHTYTPVGATISKTANVRIIAATNRNLRDMVVAGKMREDFFHRLHVLAIELPPLRWHKEDIPLLIEHFCRQYNSPGVPPPQIPPAIVERLCAYDWPGNVRELYNELRRYLSIGEIELAGRVAAEDAESRPRQITLAGRTFDEILAATERETIVAALSQTNGNKAEAAKLLQMPRSSLFRKIQQYGL